MKARIEFLALAACALAGCAGETFAPDTAPEYVAIRERTPLYRFGPAQGGAPEAQVLEGDRVKMLRREFGYSLVQLGDGMTGYVANQDFAPAPPLPEPPEIPDETPQDFAPPLPPVEPALPGPDLDAVPEDAPSALTP